MSDGEEITRKIPGGSKVIEKVEKTVEDDCEPDGKQVERVVKKRKIDKTPAKYEYRSWLEHPTHLCTLRSSIPTPTLDPAAQQAKEEEINNLELTMGKDWYEALEGEFDKSYFKGVRVRRVFLNEVPI